MEIPRNIRQIGDIDRDLSLYLEDYVATFIEKTRRKNRECVGILLGRQTKEQDSPCLFVRGAVLAENYEVEDGRIFMTASAWNEVYEQAEKCFKDVEICGWFLCSGDSNMVDLYNLQKTHSENFRSQNQVLFLYDGNRDEEMVYRFDAQGAHRLKGYYIYYERNEQMQEYMISREPERTVEFAIAPAMRGISDQAMRQFRSVMEEKQEKGKRSSGKNTISKMLRTVSVAALLCGAGFGMAAWYRHDGMRGMKEVVSVLSGEDGTAAVVEQDSAGNGTGGSGVSGETGQAVIQEVAGNVNPTIARQKETAGQEDGATQKESAGETASQASSREETVSSAGEERESAPETEAPSESEGAAASISYKEYTVRKGDTLYTICKAFYGSGSKELLSEICSINGMDNADFIYVGQVLKLPETE